MYPETAGLSIPGTLPPALRTVRIMAGGVPAGPEGIGMEVGTAGRILESVAEQARRAGVFADVRIEGGRLVCTARDAGEPAEYRVDVDGQGRLWVSLVTPNRWLSESIETDLMHTGDKMEELVDDELVELGFDAGPLKVEHFRSDDLLFTFRSQVPGTGADPESLQRSAGLCLLAYEACFRQLGDMNADSED